MDLANIRKKIKDEMLTYEIQKGITQFRNAAKNQEIDRDLAGSEFFKTLREPLIEQQKKTDEKQDKMIGQLVKNQKAIENALGYPQLPLPPPEFSELASKSAKSEDFFSPDEEAGPSFEELAKPSLSESSTESLKKFKIDINRPFTPNEMVF